MTYGIKIYLTNLKRGTMQIKSLSQFLSIFGWLSVFAQSWLFILNLIPSNFNTWIFFVFFLLIAIFASAVSSENKR